jgi:hypothetical protein
VNKRRPLAKDTGINLLFFPSITKADSEANSDGAEFSAKKPSFEPYSSKL